MEADAIPDLALVTGRHHAETRGFDKAKGIISSMFWKDPLDPTWKDAPDVKAWNVWMAKYLPKANKSDFTYVGGYLFGSILVHILQAAGDDLSRENIMHQAANSMTCRCRCCCPASPSTPPRPIIAYSAKAGWSVSTARAG